MFNEKNEKFVCVIRTKAVMHRTKNNYRRSIDKRTDVPNPIFFLLPNFGYDGIR